MSSLLTPVLLSTFPSPIPTPSTLTPASLAALLALYNPVLTHVSSTKSRKGWKTLQQLDVLRYKTLPARVQERRDARSKDGKGKKAGIEGEGWLEKEEVEDLMAWKLTRGKFRPTLLPLIKSNDAALITSATRAAFALFASNPSDPFPALKKLAELRGVGPATSSLLLAVAFEEAVPFFADEILGWLREGGGGQLKYDWKEYKEVWQGVRGVREGLDGVSAVDVEKGAWIVEMVRGMGLESEVGKKEDELSGVKDEDEIKQEEGAAGVKEEDGIKEEDEDLEGEAKPIPSTKDARITRVSARQKRMIPPSSLSPPPLNKKHKKQSKGPLKDSSR